MRYDEWFLSEFGKYGFTLSHEMYNVYTFRPFKVVEVRDRNRLFRTNIKITPELADDDIRGWGVPYDHCLEEFREMVRVQIREQYGHLMNIDFKPNKKIIKFSFI